MRFLLTNVVFYHTVSEIASPEGKTKPDLLSRARLEYGNELKKMSSNNESEKKETIKNDSQPEAKKQPSPPKISPPADAPDFSQMMSKSILGLMQGPNQPANKNSQPEQAQKISQPAGPSDFSQMMSKSLMGLLMQSPNQPANKNSQPQQVEQIHHTNQSTPEPSDDVAPIVPNKAENTQKDSNNGGMMSLLSAAARAYNGDKDGHSDFAQEVMKNGMKLLGNNENNTGLQNVMQSLGSSDSNPLTSMMGALMGGNNQKKENNATSPLLGGLGGLFNSFMGPAPTTPAPASSGFNFMNLFQKITQPNNNTVQNEIDNKNKSITDILSKSLSDVFSNNSGSKTKAQQHLSDFKKAVMNKDSMTLTQSFLKRIFFDLLEIWHAVGGAGKEAVRRVCDQTLDLTADFLIKFHTPIYEIADEYMQGTQYELIYQMSKPAINDTLEKFKKSEDKHPALVETCEHFVERQQGAIYNYISEDFYDKLNGAKFVLSFAKGVANQAGLLEL